MSAKTTTYLKKGGQRERLSTQNMARIPGVVITNKETRDLIKRKRTTAQEPAQAVEATWDVPESPAPERTRAVTEQVPAVFDDFNMPPVSTDPEPPATATPRAESDRQTQGIETRAPVQPPANPGFQPPWASAGTAPTPVSRRGSPNAPEHVAPVASLQQVWIVVSCQVGGTEVANLPGLQTVVRVPIVRVEATFASHDDAFAAAARFNREHAPQGKVYSVSVGALPALT